MYQAVYKCRLCGEKFCNEKFKAEKIEDFTITNALAQIEQIALMEKPNRIDLHMFHKCQNGSLGFADFQGFKKTEE